MCSFTVLGGGPKTSQYLVWPPFSSRSATHLLRIELIRLLIVACGMLVHSSSVLDIGRNWNTLSYTPIQSIPNMLNGWHVRWVCWPCKNWDVFSFQELCTDPCNMGPCIIMLQHEAMVMDEWHNNGPQDLVTVSLCIQNAINKMHLYSLSIIYACPYHNPTATMGHLIHNVNISKTLTRTTPYMLSAICPVQWKPVFIREENTSSKSQMPSNVSICPLKSVTTTKCCQLETPMRTTSMQMSFPETVSDSLCRNSLVMQTDCCSSCPGGWSQTRLVWFQVVCSWSDDQDKLIWFRWCQACVAVTRWGVERQVCLAYSQAMWWDCHGLGLHVCYRHWGATVHWGNHENQHELWHTEAEHDPLPSGTGPQGSIPTRWWTLPC